MHHQPKRILVLYRLHYPLDKLRLSSLQHLQVLEKSEQPHEIIYFNAVFGVPRWFKYLDFDVVILSTLFLGMRWFPRYFKQWKQSMHWIADLDCLKIAMPQDEYDHAHDLDKWLNEWGVQVIFTNFDESYRQTLYPSMHQKAEFHECFTGYIDTSAIDERIIQPIADRPLDIVYRARHLPYWFGKYGQFKHRIAEKISEHAPQHQLKIDVSTNHNDTITGGNWIPFMASAKATIGCESGVSALDPNGEIKHRVLQWLKQEPQLTFEQVSERLPDAWDEYEFFAIGPRHFEATQTRTCQILIRGNYSGVLQADRHYIPIEQDFSNLDEALEKLKDDDTIQAMVDRAYKEIACNPAYTYSAFVAEIDSVIAQHTVEKPYQKKPFLRFLATVVSAITDTIVRVADWAIRSFGIRKIISKLFSGA